MHFVDRKAKYPGRWTMKKSDGSSEIVTLIRNDEPIVEGTPMNAETLNTLSDVAGAEIARQQAEAAREAAAGSATQAAGSASAAEKSKTAAATSERNAAKHEEAAKKYSDEAGAKAGTDKTLSIENAPADAAAVRKLIEESLAAQRAEDYARIKFWASDDPTSPASFIGGTWERIEGKFIMGASDTYPAGSTGGNAIHTHELDKLVAAIYPGGFYFDYKYVNSDLWESNYTNSVPNGEAPIKQKNYSNGIEVIGRPTKTSSNIPPYYSMYIWRRVA